MSLSLCFGLLFALLGPASAFSSPPGNAFRFFHDSSGRLKAAIDPGGDTAIYAWDSAGNLLSISRHPSGKLSIVQLSPGKGEVGATVTIEGTGFSTTPASDTVKFNGTAATVSAATATSLTVKIPGGATSGSVSVSTPEEGPVTSPESFTVAESTAPHVSSIAATIAATGDEVTISGSNFESSASLESVTLNRARPEVTNASTSSIKFKVPTGALGGHVSVATAEGSGTGPDLYIPPNGLTPSKVGSTGRFSLGASKTAEIPSVEKVALLLFDGVAGQAVSMSLSESTVTSGTASIWSPTGSQLVSASFAKSGGGFLERVVLPYTGTYTVLLSPTTGSGSVKVTSYLLEDVTGSIVPEATTKGTTQHVAISVPGQAARYSVTMTAGERVALKTTNSAFSGKYKIKWLNSKEEVLYSELWNGTENWFWNPKTFSGAGTYTLLVDPESSYTGSVDLKLWEVPADPTGSITPTAGGASKTFAISIPGQRELVSFTGTEGKRLNFQGSESSITKGTLSVLRPNGSELAGSSGSLTELRGPLNLPESGTYTFVIDPEQDYTGSLKLTAWEFEDVTGSITPEATTAGTTQHIAISLPGQVARYSVAMSAGERVALKTTNTSFSAGFYIKWLNSKGETLYSEHWASTENWFWNPKIFSSPGTYTLELDPDGTGVGSVDLKLWEVPADPTGSITPSAEGASKAFTISIPGQRQLVTFSGTSGQRISFLGKESTITGGTMSLLRPNGSELTGSSGALTALHGSFALPETGTYTIVIDPEKDYIGSLTLTTWIAEDATGSITPTAEGASKTFSTSIPGQRDLVTFSGTSGQRISLLGKELSITAGAISVTRPNGSELSGSGGSLTELHGPMTLPESGTYTIVIDPESSYTGSITLTAWIIEDITGSITPEATAEGTKQHVAISVPGQAARYSVKMTAGERVALKTTNSAFSGKYWISWLNSKEEVLYTLWWNGTENWFWNPKTFSGAGTYTLLVDPESSYTGSVDLKLWEVPADPTGSITPTAEGASKTFSVSIPGQSQLVTFSGTSAQKVDLQGAESTISAGTMSITRPNGSELSGSKGNLTDFRGPLTLPETGTYTILVDPEADYTGSLKLTVWEFKDVTGSITPTATTEGVTQHVAINTPGQVARYSVTMTAGERVALKTTNSAFSGKYHIRWLNSKSEMLFEEYWNSTENWFWNPKTFSSAGTYTVEVDPDTTATGSVDLKLWEVPADPTGSITPTTEGESKSFSITIPGQRELVSFSGTSGQTVTMKALESTIAEGTLSILKPDGTQLGSSATFKPSTTARIEASLPTTGTYTVVLDPIQDNTGSVKLTAYLGSHAAWFGPIGPATELVGFETASTQSPQGYSDIPVKSESTAIAKAAGRPGSASKDSSVTSATHRKPAGRRKGAHGSPSQKAKPPEPQHAARPKAHQQKNASTKPEGVSKERPSTHRRHRVHKEGFITPQMRAFHPNAASAWHPPRTTRGVHGWEAGEPQSPWSVVAQLQAPPGMTALAGQALAINGLPIAGVRVSLEGSSASARTDDAGRFLLAGVPAGHQVLVIDGETTSGKERYGSYETGVDLANHQTTTLEYTVWLTPLDSQGDQRIKSPTARETRLTTPGIPGLEVRIPAGTMIRDAAGHAVKKLNISPIPVDRPPFPLPPFVSVPIYFTVQPGRAYLSKGAQIVYPNWAHQPPGQRVDFWNYDPIDRGWYVYGHGTVTPDGKQVMPDPGVRVWEFTGAMFTNSPKPPPDGPFPSDSTTLGDPVDLYSGLFVYHKTDLTLPDSIPIVIQRTYRPRDTNSYSFGNGTTSLYDMRVWSEHNYTEADLVMPDGGRVNYVRTSPGAGYKEAIYEATNTSGGFFGSTITWDESVPGWNLKLRNGITFVFGELAPLQAIRDRFGNTLTITRSEGQKGNITRITSPHGRWVKFSYDGSNRITEVTDNGGRHVKYSYTSGNLTKVEGLAGRTTEYEYDEAGRMKAVINARGNKYLQVAYDANGRVEKQTTADGVTLKFAYELGEGGKVKATTVTDPLGSQHKTTFDAEGFPVSETEAPGTELAQTTSIERQPKTGLILSETDPLGRVTDFEYDSSGNVKELTRLAGTEEARTAKFAYEPATDLLTEATDPLGHTIKYAYGLKGQLLKRTDPLGHETIYEENAEGQPTAVTNPAGETTKFTYDHGDLSVITDPLGRETHRFVDTLGRLGAVTSPGGQQTRYGYNDADQLTSVKMPSGAETSIEYDKDGNLSALVDPRSNKTTRTYDSMDRLESETDPLGRKAEWSYNKAGDLKEVIDRNGTVSTFSFDPLRRLSKASYGVSGESAESTIDYEYDDANRPIHVDDSASGEYGIDYDGLGQIEDVEGPNGTVAYAYDEAGRPETMLVSGQEPVEYSFDKADRLTGISRGEGVSLQYDKADRPEAITLPDGIEEQYGYDLAGETTSITYKGNKGTLGVIDYAYDPNGQVEATWGSYARLGLPEALASTEYNADNELVKRESKELEYDKDGNLISDGTSEYTWDARGQLTGISGGTSANFSYDPFGRRIAKTLGGVTTELLYDGLNPAQESVKGSVTASLLSGLVPDQLFSRTTESGTENYLTDRLGSTVGLANSSGEVGTTYTYDPFGASTESGEESGNPFQFTGRENDGTGLQYNRARYYDPASARFISQDPAGFEGSGANLYWYANGDPVDFSDPSGESVGDWPGGSPGTNSGPGFPFPFGPAPIFTEGDSSLPGLEGFPPSRSPIVREAPSQEALEEGWREAQEKGRPHPNPGEGYPGEEVELPNGTRVGYRPKSRSGGPAIDIKKPDGSEEKIHTPRSSK